MELISQKSDKKNLPYLLLMAFAFCDQTILQYVVVAVGKIPVISSMSTFIRPIFYGTLIILIWIASSRNFNISVSYVVVPIFFICAILLTIIIYPDNWLYINDFLFEDILPCLPFFVLGIMFKADKKTLDFIGKLSCVAIIVNVIYILYFLSTRELSYDSMYRSYLLLPNVLFAILYASSSKKLVPWICAIAGMIYILAMGTRGPVVIVLAYLLLNFLMTEKIRSKKRLVVGIIGIFAVLFIVIYQSEFYYDILRYISNIFDRVGLSTRVIDNILSGEFISNTSGRDAIFADVIDKIMQRPILGYGVYGEWCWGYHSAHNMYLELMVHFGIPLGLLLLISGIVVVVYAFVRNKNYYSRSIILIWATHVFVQGIFGGSYLRYGVFFLIGFCLKEINSLKYDSAKYLMDKGE